MNERNSIPAVLLYYDRAGQLQQAETNAAPFDCDNPLAASHSLAVRRPALVTVGDVAAVLAELRWLES